MLKIPVDTERKKMPAGGYVCRIVKSEAGINRYEEPCLLLYLDVAEGKFEKYFGTIYTRRLAHGADKYPCIYIQSMSEFSAKKFNRLMTAIKASNISYVSTCKCGTDWNERELENLLIGVVFREKEYTNSRGKKHVILIPYEFRNADEIRRGEFKVPARLYE